MHPAEKLPLNPVLSVAVECVTDLSTTLYVRGAAERQCVGYIADGALAFLKELATIDPVLRSWSSRYHEPIKPQIEPSSLEVLVSWLAEEHDNLDLKLSDFCDESVAFTNGRDDQQEVWAHLSGGHPNLRGALSVHFVGPYGFSFEIYKRVLSAALNSRGDFLNARYDIGENFPYLQNYRFTTYIDWLFGARRGVLRPDLGPLPEGLHMEEDREALIFSVGETPLDFREMEQRARGEHYSAWLLERVVVPIGTV